MYICGKVLWQDALPLTNSDTFGSPRPPPVPTDLGCVVHQWYHEIVVLFRGTTDTAPGCQPVDPRCEATLTQVVTG